jgi:hypothetical protein
VVQEHKKKLVLVLPESPLSTAQQQIMGPAIPASTLGCPQTASGCDTLGSVCGFTSAPDCTRPKQTFQCPPSTGSSCQPATVSGCEITGSDCVTPIPRVTVSQCPRPPSTGSSCQPATVSGCEITGSGCITPIPKTVSQCAPSTGSSCQPATVSGCSPTPGKP